VPSITDSRSSLDDAEDAMHCERLIFASRPRRARALTFLFVLATVLGAGLLKAVVIVPPA
jgi:hypothetical protein